MVIKLLAIVFGILAIASAQTTPVTQDWIGLSGGVVIGASEQTIAHGMNNTCIKNSA